MIFINLF